MHKQHEPNDCQLSAWMHHANLDKVHTILVSMVTSDNDDKATDLPEHTVRRNSPEFQSKSESNY